MSKTITYHGNDGPRVVVDEIAFDAGEPVEVDSELADQLLKEYPGKFTTGEGPAKTARKEVWEAFRAAQGHDVDGLTRDELIDLPDTPANTQES